MKYTIDINEFSLRVVQTQEAMQNAGIDILMAFGNEAEPQYVRYYADYWPSFESSCVLIPLKGSPYYSPGRKPRHWRPTPPKLSGSSASRRLESPPSQNIRVKN